MEKNSRNNDMFQGICLEATDGHMWMSSYFDYFHPHIRERLRQSPFNLCSACVGEKLGDRFRTIDETIGYMEQLLKEEGENGI